MDEIQGNIITRGKRNPISRRFRAKDDKEAIAAWRSDLDRILRVFNVGSVASVRPLLIPHFQNELGTSKRATVSDIRQDAVTTRTIVSVAHLHTPNTETTVPDVRRDDLNTRPIVSKDRSDDPNTRTIVSDGHRNKLKSREDAGGKIQVVSTARTTTAQDHARSVTPTTTESTVQYLHPAHLEIHHLRHREIRREPLSISVAVLLLRFKPWFPTSVTC